MFIDCNYENAHSAQSALFAEGLTGPSDNDRPFTDSSRGRTEPILSKFPGLKGVVPLWLAIPAGYRPETKARPLIAMHGIKRDAKGQAQTFSAYAKETGRLVIAPHFSKRRWRRFQWAANDNRPDLALIAALRSLEGSVLPVNCLSSDKPFDLFGFSGGGQLAHRFAMLYPQLVHRLAVASAGWYTFPDRSAYPLGLGHHNDKSCELANRTQREFNNFLRIPTNVFVGTRDCVIDKNTRTGPDIDPQQGRTRLARGQRWVAAMTKAAQERGLKSRFEFTPLAGCDHSFAGCVRKGDLVGRVMAHMAPGSGAQKNNGKQS